MNEQDYISERVDVQQKWYSKNSTKNKRYFVFFSLLASISAITIDTPNKTMPVKTKGIITLKPRLNQTHRLDL